MTLNISYYLDGEARTTAALNRPLEQLAAAVSALQALSGDGGSSGRVVAHGVPAEGAAVGDIVYLDNGSGQARSRPLEHHHRSGWTRLPGGERSSGRG